MKIGIIGASSQVGASVAVHLKMRADVDVVCFIRSIYSDIYFEILEIPVEHIDFTNKEDTTAKFKNLDALVDFSYPTGQLHQIKRSIRYNLEFTISCLSQKTTFIYMSSIMAYGMAPTELYVRNVVFPSSSYAYFKRYAEEIVLNLGKKNKLRTYNFRLGQVHGALQSVTRSFRSRLSKDDSVYIYGEPSDLTNIIFPSSIAESIIKCLNGNVVQGTYTLVSTPQWRLEELYRFYADYYESKSNFVFVAPKKKGFSIQTKLLRFLRDYRLQLETYVLLRMPLMSLKIKGKYRINEIANLIQQRKMNSGEIDLNLLGRPSQKILHTQNSSIELVRDAERKFEAYYDSTILANR